MENVKYEIVYDEMIGSHVIEITGGENTGVQFSFGPIEAVENTDEDNVNIRFDYHLHSIPEQVDVENIEAVQLLEADIAEILHDVLSNTLVTPEQTEGE
jgi:pantothenate kinase